MQLLIHTTAGLVVVNKGPLQSGSTCTGRKWRHSDIASYSRIHMANCLRERIFAGTNFCVLPFHREKHALQKFPATQ